jgi:O-antigen/teichoic acid export membrane protein
VSAEDTRSLRGPLRRLMASGHRVFRPFNILSWGVLSYGFGGTAARVIDLVTGILIVRSLSPARYAIYAIIVGTAPIFSAILISGIFPALLKNGASASCDVANVLEVQMSAERALIKENFWPSVAILVISTILIARISSDPVQIFLGVLATISLSGILALQSLSDAALQLARKHIYVAGGAFLQSLIRAGGLPLLLLGDSAAIPLVFISVAAIGCNFKFCCYAMGRRNPVRPETLKEFSRQVVEIRQISLLTDLFQAGTGQFYYWMLAIFSGPVAVAGFAALTRLGQVTYPLTLLFRGYFVPGFASLPSGSSLQKYFYFLSMSSLLLFAPIIMLAWIYPKEVLGILGADYVELTLELKLYAVGLGLWIASDLADQLLRSRGDFMSAWLAILLDSTALVAPLSFLGDVTIVAVLWSLVTVSVVRLMRFGIFALSRFRRVGFA